MPPLESHAGADDLALAGVLLANAKKLALFVAGVAYQKYGDRLLEEQEAVACLSDMIIDIYLAESAWLRTLKNRAAGGASAVMTDLTLAYVNGAVGRWESEARKALAEASAGDELRTQLGIVRRLLRWTAVNEIAVNRRIAKRLCDTGSYPGLLSGR